AFNLFAILQVPEWRPIIFYILVAIMFSGFLLMFIGSRLEAARAKQAEGESVARSPPKVEGLSEEQEEFLASQYQYIAPPVDKGGGTKKLLILTGIIILAAVVLGLLKLFPLDLGLYAYSIAFEVAAVACLVSFVVGNLNEDLWRFYLLGYHVHESFIGIYFILIGGPLVAVSMVAGEFEIGLAFLAAGVFLIGRDWRDVAEGHILVHKSNEPDYADYQALKARQKEITGA
ncbi:MAG TPA: hypothetical protein VKK79_16180, partial [Candidatus Lokiarchaeia archaeon]|nr:hypothetical protein [Candidatus Lokiarchaeia archaeon]